MTESNVEKKIDQPVQSKKTDGSHHPHNQQRKYAQEIKIEIGAISLKEKGRKIRGDRCFKADESLKEFVENNEFKVIISAHSCEGTLLNKNLPIARFLMNKIQNEEENTKDNEEIKKLSHNISNKCGVAYVEPKWDFTRRANEHSLSLITNKENENVYKTMIENEIKRVDRSPEELESNKLKPNELKVSKSAEIKKSNNLINVSKSRGKNRISNKKIFVDKVLESYTVLQKNQRKISSKNKSEANFEEKNNYISTDNNHCVDRKKNAEYNQMAKDRKNICKEEITTNFNYRIENYRNLPITNISDNTSDNTTINSNETIITKENLGNKIQTCDKVITKINRTIDLSVIYNYYKEEKHFTKNMRKTVEKFTFLFTRVLKLIKERKNLYFQAGLKKEVFQRNILIYRKNNRNYIDMSLLNLDEQNKIIKFLQKKFAFKIQKNEYECQVYLEKLFGCYREKKEEIKEVDNFIFKLFDYIDKHKMTCAYAFEADIDIDEVNEKIRTIENKEYYNIEDVDICTNIHVMMFYIRVTIDGAIPLCYRKILLEFHVKNNENKLEYILRFLPFIVGFERRKIILRLIDLLWIAKSNFREIEVTDFMIQIFSQCIFPLNEYYSTKNMIYAFKLVKRLFEYDFFSISPRLYINANKI